MQSYAWTSPQWTLPLPACRAGNLQEMCWQTWVFWMKSFKDRLTVHGHCGVWTRVCRRCFSLGQRCWNETATLKFQPYLSRFNSELSTSAPLHRGCFAECDLHQNPAALNEWTTHRLMKWLDMFVRREKTEGAEACWRMPIWGSEAGVWKISSPPSYSTCDFGMFITVVCMWMFSFPFLSSLNRVCSQVTTCLWILSQLLHFEAMTKGVQMMSCEQQSPRYISLQSIQASRIKLLLLISTVFAVGPEAATVYTSGL